MKKGTKMLTLLLSGAFAISSLTGCFSGNNNSSSSSSSSSPSASGGGNGDTYTLETLYAKAQDLGFEGTLEEFKEYVKGDKGDEGAKGDDGVGIEDIYVSGGDLYIVLSNGDEYNCGSILGEKGDPGDPGAPGTPGTPGAPGAPGENGSKWFSGNGAPGTISGVKVGDFYFDNASGNVYEYKSSGWVFSTCLKPVKSYVGYDGYVWEGAERTEQKVNLDRAENVLEDTLALNGNEYFAEKAVSTKTKRIAMMSGYKPLSKNTKYSNCTIQEITFYAQTAGTLEIGKINLLSGVASEFSAYSVVAGKNTVMINMTFGANETLAFGGGQTSVNMLASSGVFATDGWGEFSSDTSTFAIDKTASANDKLVISATLYSNPRISYAFREAQTHIYNAEFPHTTGGGGGHTYYDLNVFSGKKVNKIGMYVMSVAALDGAQTFTIARIKKDSIKIGGAATVVQEYVIKPYSSIWGDNSVTSTTVDRWMDFDVSAYNIEVAEDETLAFGANDDTIKWLYFNGLCPFTYAFYTDVHTSAALTYSNGSFALGQNNTAGLAFTFELEELETIETHKETLAIAEAKKYLVGKKLSVLGDSISTYEGYSDDTTRNSTLGYNPTVFAAKWFYPNYDTRPSVDAVYNDNLHKWLPTNGTWWLNSAAQTGMEILVNNAFSGSWVWNNAQTDADFGGKLLGSSENRACNLHNDHTNVNPDIIAVYMGTNDYLMGKSWGLSVGGPVSAARIKQLAEGTAQPTNFAEGYALLLSRVTKKYSNADVFCFTVLPCQGASESLLAEYNNAIRSLAAYFGLPVVDLHDNLGVSYQNYDAYYLDEIHPNALGMSLIADEFVKALYNHFGNQ